MRLSEGVTKNPSKKYRKYGLHSMYDDNQFTKNTKLLKRKK